MNYFMLNIVLALVWAILAGKVNSMNLVVGFALGYLTLFIARRALGSSAYIGKAWTALRFAVFFLKELVLSNLYLAWDVLTPHINLMKPRVIAVPLNVTTEIEITSLANLISLTPGSLSLDVSSDRRSLYVHFMYAQDAETAKRGVKQGMERWVHDLFSEEKE